MFMYIEIDFSNESQKKLLEKAKELNCKIFEDVYGIIAHNAVICQLFSISDKFKDCLDYIEDIERMFSDYLTFNEGAINYNKLDDIIREYFDVESIFDDENDEFEAFAKNYISYLEDNNIIEPGEMSKEEVIDLLEDENFEALLNKLELNEDTAKFFIYLSEF